MKKAIIILQSSHVLSHSTTCKATTIHIARLIASYRGDKTFKMTNIQAFRRELTIQNTYRVNRREEQATK